MKDSWMKTKKRWEKKMRYKELKTHRQVLAVSVRSCMHRRETQSSESGVKKVGTRYLSIRDMSCRQALAVSSSDTKVLSRVSCSSTSVLSLSISLLTVCRRFLNSGKSFSWRCTMDCLKYIREKKNLSKLLGMFYLFENLISSISNL